MCWEISTCRAKSTRDGEGEKGQRGTAMALGMATSMGTVCRRPRRPGRACGDKCSSPPSRKDLAGVQCPQEPHHQHDMNIRAPSSGPFPRLILCLRTPYNDLLIWQNLKTELLCDRPYSGGQWVNQAHLLLSPQSGWGGDKEARKAPETREHIIHFQNRWEHNAPWGHREALKATLVSFTLILKATEKTSCRDLCFKTHILF